MICTLAVMYSYVHSSNTTLWLFSVVIKEFFFYTAAVNKEYNSTETRNTIPSWSLEWHSDSTVTERAHSLRVCGGWRDGIELPADGGQCDWHSWHLGTVAVCRSTRLLKWCVDWSGGLGRGSVAFLHFSLFLYCLRFLFWKPLRSKFPHSERGDEKAPSFETCPSSNVNKRGDDSYL